jgi:hypothetical protein
MTEMNVVTPRAFNERFTIYLNAAGEPVERSLAEMEATEVGLAFRWLDSEVARLRAEFSPINQAARVFHETGTMPPELAALTRDEWDQAQAALKAAGDAIEKERRLFAMIEAMIPERYREQPLGKSLPLWWRKGGRKPPPLRHQRPHSNGG